MEGGGAAGGGGGGATARGTMTLAWVIGGVAEMTCRLAGAPYLLMRVWVMFAGGRLVM